MKPTKSLFKLVCYIITLVFPAATNGQNPNFSLPNKYFKISPPTFFNLPTPGGMNYAGAPAFSSHNSMIDNTPLQLQKFFIVDENVYKSNGELMIDDVTLSPTGMYTPNGSPEAKGNTEICIVPDPANCTKYYVFSASIDPLLGSSDHWFPTYSVVDAAAGTIHHFAPFTTAFDLRALMIGLPAGDGWGEGGDNFSGGLVSGDATRPTIAATKPLSNGSYMVFIYDGIRHIYKFNVTTTGVFFGGLVFTLNHPLPFFNFTGQYQRAELEIIEKPGPGGGYRIAGAAWLHDNGGIKYIFPQPTIFTGELAPSGLLVPGTDKYFTYLPAFVDESFIVSNIHGLEFSPNSDYLYVSHWRENLYGSAPDPIEYFNCTLAIFAPETIPLLDPNTAEPFEFSQLEYGLDGKIYATDGVTLATINDPNNPTTTTFTPIAVTIPGGYGYTDEGTNSNYLKTYTLPDQIDGLNYSNQFLGQQCCIESALYDKISFTANSLDVSWTPGSNPLVAFGSVAHIRDIITIPQNLTITISNMQLYFAPGAKILVERGSGPADKGGILNLVNCLLTVDEQCTSFEMWNGIEVEGYNNEPQILLSNTRQGQLKMLSGTKIEHAYVGAAAAKFSTFNPATQTFIQDATYGGGVIRMDNSTIENCYIGLWFADYVYNVPNTSYVYRSKFRTTQLLKNPAYTPGAFVSIINNSGIRFRSNIFENINPTLFSQNLRGYGIFAIGSTFYLNQDMFSPVLPNTFTNLWYGVISFPTIGLKPVYSNKSFFNNCFHGIFLSGSNYSTITENNFNIPLDPVYSPVDKPYGLLMTGCTGYQVEANSFHSLFGAVNNYGIIVDNSGTLNNVIYRNDFKNLFIGGQSQGINGSTAFPNFGLRWACNTFSTGTITRADLAYTTGRIAQIQLPCNKLNLFSVDDDLIVLDHDFAANPPPFISTLPILYPLHASYPYKFNDFNSSIFTTYGPCTTPSGNPTPQSCPGTLGPFALANIIPIKIGMQAATTSITNLLNLIDGGNQQTLIDAINTYSNGNLKNLLLNYSPYLSDEVLVAYINNVNIPVGHLKEVIIANSPVSSDVYDLVVSKNLPNGIMNQINAAQTGVSGRQQLLGEIDLLHSERNEGVNQIIRIYLNDTIIENPIDSVIAILEQEIAAYPEMKEILTLAVLEKGDGGKVATLKDEIVAAEGYTNFCKFIDVALGIGSVCNVKHAICSNPTLKAQIEEIAYDISDGKNAFYGKNILNMAFDTLFPGIIEELIPYQAYSIITQPQFNNSGSDVSTYVYPNPATNSVNIQLSEDVDTENMIAYLYNNLGQNMAYKKFEGNLMAVFDVQNLANGIYLITVLDNGTLISVQKVIVNH